MEDNTNRRLSIGVSGLDEILEGGLLPCQAYLVRGDSGTGKTTLGLHFLQEGVRQGESVLLISLMRGEEEIRRHAASLGISLDGVTVLDLSPTPELFTELQSYRVFQPSDVERGPLTQQIMERLERQHPRRILVDALTQLRYVATDEYDFRRLSLSLLRYLTGREATLLVTSEIIEAASDASLKFLCAGVIELCMSRIGRTVQVTKYVGSGFRFGIHSMRLDATGMVVFPQLEADQPTIPFTGELISSGIPALDDLLHGGIERGLSTIITGPSGVGKTTIGMHFVKEAATRGERSAVFIYEEAYQPLRQRMTELGIPMQRMLDDDTLAIIPVQPLRYLPDEFTALVRAEVEERNTRVVMLDSLAGYRLTLHGADLTSHLYTLIKYLAGRGVTVILLNDVEMITGDFRATEVGISYIADNIIFLRYIEVHGALQKAIGVLKKRMSGFEKTMREIDITPQGITLGPPLVDLRGILLGVPEWSEPDKAGE
ncbi:MAG: Circadian clock protein kinase KaiC [bacterium ADurb.Bin429]|nr:MAG: Circadian clock protein kinase KaiC [bacterium ADurb.Bin429]